MQVWGKEGDQKHLSIPLQLLSLQGSPSLLLYPASLIPPPHLSPCPFFTYLLSPPLLLTPSLFPFLIRAGRTMVPLLPLFGNAGLKQMLFTKAVPHPRPSPSLQPSPTLIESASARINHLASFIPSSSPSPSLPLVSHTWVRKRGDRQNEQETTTAKTRHFHVSNLIFSQWPS